MRHQNIVLPIIVFAQFCCTSLWFAGNAIMSDLITQFGLDNAALGHLTASVQFGFIIGTFLFAFLTITDRFSPSVVFFVCALLGAFINIFLVVEGHSLLSLFLLRFFVGFFLAGIYPVGMKIASDYFKAGLGKSLGFLVGALVLGTAFPHALKSFQTIMSWQVMVYITSGLAALGGIMMLIGVPNGPYRTSLQRFDGAVFYNVFKVKAFRKAAFGYFGHMWELYAFWTFVPVVLAAFAHFHSISNFNVPVFSFLVIAIGSLGCIISGYLSQLKETKLVATYALMGSGICCVLSPFVFTAGHVELFIGFLVVWGMLVIADSPLFSTLVAQNAPPASKGTALTIVNSIGFAITIVSIQLLNYLQTFIGIQYIFLVLAIGPAVGIYVLFGTSRSNS
jgi:MFS family permease